MDTLKMQQYDTGDRREVRGQFELAGTDWSWGRENGKYWAECIEVFAGREDLVGEYREGMTIKQLAKWLSELADCQLVEVAITDDFGKTKTYKTR